MHLISTGEMKGRPGKAVTQPDALDTRWELRNPALLSQWQPERPMHWKSRILQAISDRYEARS